MKTTHRTIIVCLVPFLSALPSLAQGDAKTDPPSAVSDQKAQLAWMASELIGADVKTSSKETIGKIKDVAFNLHTGEIVGLVIEAGGFLGIGDAVSVIPSNAVSYDAESKSFTTSMTKEQLGKAQQFKSEEWKAASGTSMAAKLRATRDAIGGDVSKPDNTAQNEKDMKEKTVTPIDQGNSEEDVKITKDIRSALVGSDLSFNAKNIKIITNDGIVTLRGVVDSKEEHAAVIKLAKDHAGNSKITDELKAK